MSLRLKVAMAFLAALTFVWFSRSPLAQRRMASSEIPGRWAADRLRFTEPSGGLKATAAERQRLAANFAKIGGVFRQLPPLSPPSGLTVFLSGGFAPWLDEGPYAGPVPVRGGVLFLNRYQDCAVCPIEDATEASSLVEIAVNDPTALCESYTHENWWLAPRRVEAGPGYALYDVANPGRSQDRFLVVTRITRPMWRAVTQERFLAAAIAEARREGTKIKQDLSQSPLEEFARQKHDMEAAVREMEKVDPKFAQQMRRDMAKTLAEVEQQLRAGEADASAARRSGSTMADDRVAALEAELAALPAAGRSAPAFVGFSDRPSMLVPPAAVDAQAVVTVNPQFFDPTLPPGALQLIVVRFQEQAASAEQADAQDQRAAVLRAVRSALDWRALAALVQP